LIRFASTAALLFALPATGEVRVQIGSARPDA
jgi:hypothetical protein